MEKTVSNQPILKMVLIGPESTGKTTLSVLLAKHHQTVFCEEYMRTYLQKKWDLYKKKCEWDDLIPIIKGQIKSEDQQLKKANNILFLDTNPFVLYVYSKLYYQGKCPQEIIHAVESRFYHHYLLTSVDDIPWEFDVLRDRPNGREKIFDLFKVELIKRKLPFSVLSGSLEERIKQTNIIIEKFIRQSSHLNFTL